MTGVAAAAPRHARPLTRFVLPDDLIARAPVTASGRRRDEVRMLVAGPDRLEHRGFRDLPTVLDPGDLVVVNTSATVPSALPATRADGRSTVVHLAGPVPHTPGGPTASRLGRSWVVELRRPDGHGPQLDGVAGELIRCRSGARITLQAPRSDGRGRLWDAWVAVDADVVTHLRRHGQPIAYGYLRQPPSPDDHTTVFGRDSGSAEPPSAGLPFRHRSVTALITRGVQVAPVTLHTGVSSLEVDEQPPAERYRVPPTTAALVADTRRRGGRIVAVGTTVVRALETVAGEDGAIGPGAGWTELVLGPQRPARVVDGLLTGWHAPEASHLALLEAVAGPRTVGSAYAAGLAARYRWHEFGDLALLLGARAEVRGVGQSSSGSRGSTDAIAAVT